MVMDARRIAKTRQNKFSLRERHTHAQMQQQKQIGK